MSALPGRNTRGESAVSGLVTARTLHLFTLIIILLISAMAAQPPATEQASPLSKPEVRPSWKTEFRYLTRQELFEGLRGRRVGRVYSLEHRHTRTRMKPLVEGERIVGFRVECSEDHPLARLGVRSGDVLFAHNGAALNNAEALVAFGSALHRDPIVRLGVRRGKRQISLCTYFVDEPSETR